MFKNHSLSFQAMPIKKHDFVELDYTGRIKETNEVFDTTNEKAAKEAQIFSPKVEYKPIVICIGESHILAGLDEFIEGKELGKYTVSLNSEKAFGKKDASLMKIIPTSKFAEQGIKPIPNLRLNIDGMVGMIKSVSSGRTVVDFNHPLTGKDVVYDIKLNKVVTDKKIQLTSILRVLLGMRDPDVELAGNKAKLQIPELPKPLLDELAKKMKELTGVEVSFEHPKHEHKHEHDEPSEHDHDSHDQGHEHLHEHKNN